MIEHGPVAAYLRELRHRLPYPAPRFLAETREHLVEATARGLAQGASQAEAESAAVQGFGPVSEVVDSVVAEGGALMSPRLVRWFAPAALLLCLPAFVFVTVNMIELLASNAGGEGVFGSTFDTWRTQITGLLVAGPLVALGLIVAAGVRVHRDRGVKGFSATAELKMSRPTMWAAAVATAVSAALVGYVVVDNYGEWRDFHNANWSCTSTAEGKQLCVEGSYPPEKLDKLRSEAAAG